MTPTVDASDIVLSLNESLTFQWTFSGLNVNISRCRLDSVCIIMKPCQSKSTDYLVEKPEIMIHDSSFGNLDLNPATKAQITDCYIDGEFKDRPTLITANNSDVSIQNCHFENFINEKGSTILFGHNNSQVTIENSVFIQHSSPKGVIFLQNKSFMFISSSLFLHNVAYSVNFSPITLNDGINTVVNNTVFSYNSAINGGAMNVFKQCKVTLNNCTFSSNKAIAGKTPNIPRNPHVEVEAYNRDKHGTFRPLGSILYKQPSSHDDIPKVNPEKTKSSSRNSTALPLDQHKTGTFMPIIPALFDQTSSDVKQPKVKRVQTHRLINSSFLGNTVQQGYLAGIGGAVQIETQSHLLVINCSFRENLAETIAGAIGGLNVTVDIQGTTFVGNKASQG